MLSERIESFLSEICGSKILESSIVRLYTAIEN